MISSIKNSTKAADRYKTAEVVTLEGDELKVKGRAATSLLAGDDIDVFVNDKTRCVYLSLPGHGTPESDLGASKSLRSILRDFPEAWDHVRDRSYTLLVSGSDANVVLRQESIAPLVLDESPANLVRFTHPPPTTRRSLDGPVVAVFDTNFLLDYAPLRESLYRDPQNPNLVGIQVGQGADLLHGTVVASVVSKLHGLQMPDGGAARVLPIAGGSGDLLPHFEAAVEELCKKKREGVPVRILQMSVGQWQADSEKQERWKDAIEQLAANDIVLVVASSNLLGAELSTMPNRDYPAKIKARNMIVVADSNVVEAGDDFVDARRAYDVAVEAAEYPVTEEDGTEQLAVGSSLASPRVSAALAWLLEKNPQLSGVQACQMLRDYAASHGKDIDLQTFVNAVDAVAGLKSWQVLLHKPTA